MKKFLIIFVIAISFAFIDNVKADPISDIAVDVAYSTILPILNDYSGKILIAIGKKSPYEQQQKPFKNIVQYKMQPVPENENNKSNDRIVIFSLSKLLGN